MDRWSRWDLCSLRACTALIEAHSADPEYRGALRAVPSARRGGTHDAASHSTDVTFRGRPVRGRLRWQYGHGRTDAGPVGRAHSPPAEVPTTAATAAPTAAGSATVALSDAGNLVGANGLTLYVFDNNSAGTSSCNEGCAPTWPALTIDAGQQPQAGDGVTGELGTSDRTDGTTQVTLNGRPLYFFAGRFSARRHERRRHRRHLAYRQAVLGIYLDYGRVIS